MEIYISDDDNRLNSEIIELMHSAASEALTQEFGLSLSESGYDVSTLPVVLSVSIVNYDEIKTLNNEFRGIDRITDVLSFPQFADTQDLEADLLDLAESVSEDVEILGTMLGDVVICYDKAIEQSEEYGTGFKREIIYLFVHSIFHLFGYDHMVESDKIEMRKREESVMEVLGL